MTLLDLYKVGDDKARFMIIIANEGVVIENVLLSEISIDILLMSIKKLRKGGKHDFLVSVE